MNDATTDAATNCTCSNGDPAANSLCTMHNAEKCASCDGNYHLSNDQCVEVWRQRHRTRAHSRHAPSCATSTASSYNPTTHTCTHPQHAPSATIWLLQSASNTATIACVYMTVPADHFHPGTQSCCRNEYGAPDPIFATTYNQGTATCGSIIAGTREATESNYPCTLVPGSNGESSCCSMRDGNANSAWCSDPFSL